MCNTFGSSARVIRVAVEPFKVLSEEVRCITVAKRVCECPGINCVRMATFAKFLCCGGAFKEPLDPKRGYCPLYCTGKLRVQGPLLITYTTPTHNEASCWRCSSLALNTSPFSIQKHETNARAFLATTSPRHYCSKLRIYKYHVHVRKRKPQRWHKMWKGVEIAT